MRVAAARLLIVGVRARVGAGRAVRPVREEPALRTYWLIGLPRVELNCENKTLNSKPKTPKT